MQEIIVSRVPYASDSGAAGSAAPHVRSGPIGWTIYGSDRQKAARGFVGQREDASPGTRDSAGWRMPP